MPKVVLQMVALGLEDVVMLVFDLPAPAARLRNVHNMVSRQAMIGDKMVVRELFTRGGTHDHELEPIDRHGIVTTAQQPVIAIPIPHHVREAAMPTAAFKLGDTVVGVPKRQPLIERGMGVGLAHQDAVKALLAGSGTKRLLAGEIIAEQGHLRRRHGWGMGGQPPFARCLCAVLLVMPVLRHDVRGGQGDDGGASWAHDDGGDCRVIREGVAIRELTGETVLAMDGLRRKIIGPIACDQPLIPKDAKGVQHPVLFTALEDRNAHRIEGARRERIEQGAHRIVTGNLCHAQQGLGVTVTFGVLQPALVREKRRRLGEEDAKGTSNGVLDRVAGVWAWCAMVRQGLDALAQDGLELIEASWVRHRCLLGSTGRPTLTK